MGRGTNTDEVRVRGINSGGFGQLPKIVMVDPHIPLAAKGIFAYFVSYTGGGNNKAFPTVSTILHDLGVTSNTYYKHFNLLVELGLISVEQANRGRFMRNIYTMESFPESYVATVTDAASISGRLLSQVLSGGDLSSAGYGNIPKNVMTDRALSLEAKALFAYICVFSGASYTAAPAKKTALYHLSISSNSYSKYGTELEKHRYITRTRVQENGKFAGVAYTIMQSVATNERAETPHTNFSETEAPYTKFSDTAESHTKISDTEISCTENSETNNISSLTQTVYNTTSFNHSHAHASARTRVGEPVRTEDGEIDAEAILAEIADYGGLPYEYCEHRAKLEAAIALLTEADKHMQNPDPYESELYKLFTSALAEMLDTNAPDTSIRKATLSVIKIYKEFSRAVEAGYDDYGVPYAVAPQLYVGTRHRYIQATAKNPPKHRLNYMKAVIWTELTTAELEIQEQIAHDFADEGD